MKNMPKNMLVIPRKAGMNIDVHAFLLPTEKPDESLIEHLSNIAKIPNVSCVVGLPNLYIKHNSITGVAVAVENGIVPGIIGNDINAGIRIISIPVSITELKLQQIESALKKAIQIGEKSEGIHLNEGDMRLILELGVSAISDIENRYSVIGDIRNIDDEESDNKKTHDGGSIVTASGHISHRAIEHALNKIGTLSGTAHFIELLSIEGIFNDKIASGIGISKNMPLICFDSGSYVIGHQVAEDYIRIAREINGENASEQSFCYLDSASTETEAYLDAYYCACNFAYVNRQVISSIVRYEFRKILGNIAMPLLMDMPYNILRKEQLQQKNFWIHRRAVSRVEPPDDKGRSGTLIFISGYPSGASYLLSAGTKSPIALNSISVNAGYKSQTYRDSSAKALPHRSIDEVVRLLVDSGIAEIVARLKSIAIIG